MAFPPIKRHVIVEIKVRTELYRADPTLEMAFAPHIIGIHEGDDTETRRERIKACVSCGARPPVGSPHNSDLELVTLLKIY